MSKWVRMELPAAGETIKMGDDLLESRQVSSKDVASVPRAEALLASDVSDDADERVGVESSRGPDAAGQRNVFGRGDLAMQPGDRPKQHHDRAEAPLEELEKRSIVAPGSEDPLPELHQCSHRLMLELVTTCQQ